MTSILSASPGDVVTLRSVTKLFSNGTLALDRLSLSVKRGEFLSLLGPSGCGKSTALRIVAGLGEASSGTIVWPEHAGRPGDRAKDVGFVFQEPTLMPWASVFDNVWLPLRLRGVSRRDAVEAVTATLDAVGLAPFAAVYPRELSGGMKMRVSIARALVLKPRLLLMDEPFAALDEITRQKLNDDLLDVYTRWNCTVVFVTHSVFESVYLSNRIVVMAPRPGRAVADISVPAPYPRTPAFRTSVDYNHICRSVSEALTDAMSARVESAATTVPQARAHG